MNEALEAKSVDKRYVVRWPAAAAGTVYSGSAGQTAYPSLAAALAGLLQHETACLRDGPTAPQPPWEITCQLSPQDNRPDSFRSGWQVRKLAKAIVSRLPRPSRSRPRYVYHVNARAGYPLAGRGGGEGTEESPWWGLTTAVEQLTRLDQVGQIELRAGQMVRLAHREVFTATSLERWKKVKENIARFVLLLTALVLIVPMAAILSYLLVQAWPVLSFSFLVENPQHYMTAGGIWAPLVGTFFLVWISLLIAAPVGVLAGVYLNEYARDNWLTRIINLAVVNLAGVPSIVHALFGVGAFVMFAGMGRSLSGRLLHAGRDDAAGDHHQHAGSPGRRAHRLPRGLLEPGGLALADHPHDRLAEFDQRHPHGRDPASLAGGGRNGPHPLHRGRILQHAAGARHRGLSFPMGWAIVAWRFPCTYSRSRPRSAAPRPGLQYARPWC